tara:strand:+ start:627 stop:893 length:267 start_codon:yes stop_codon:yes gene_type:complete
MSEYPEVSVLTPTYNRKQFIELCIYNLRNQTYPLEKLEWLVLDDSEKPYSKEELINIRGSISPIKFKYLHERVKQHIGTKRNKLDILL